MKKLATLFLALLVTINLSGCVDPVQELDCEKYPTHVDCLVDDETPKTCDEGYELVDDECRVIEVNDGIEIIEIYYMNDFHGAILESDDQIGFSKIGNFLTTKVEENPDGVVILAGGDMLQGSALSNYYEGLSTIDIMDVIGFDAFILGNHEFDWGLETVTQYFDEIEENGEADFPLLGANVFLEDTTTMPDHIDPYVVIERGDIKIGVIGTMGYNLEYSIATRRVEGYEFAYPVSIIGEYAAHLRTAEDCDIVLWVGHDSGDYNEEIASLTGESRIDGMFNAHSHSNVRRLVNGVPLIQAGSNGELVGYMRIELTNGVVTDIKTDNLAAYDDALFLTEDPEVQALIDQYQDETDVLFNTPIINTAAGFNTSDLSKWIAELMKTATDSDIAFHNYGGTRDSLGSNETITLGRLYEIWPFDNVIKTVELDGATINALISSGLATSSYTSFTDGVMYKVATNDYVFDKTSNPFLDGDNIENTGILLRDLAEDELLLQKDVYSSFDVDNEILTNSQK